MKDEARGLSAKDVSKAFSQLSSKLIKAKQQDNEDGKDKV